MAISLFDKGDRVLKVVMSILRPVGGKNAAHWHWFAVDRLDDTELVQLFRRGFRAERARKVAGAGLGLYFCNGIVTAHGGHMWAESPGRDQGSTFCFTLPLREDYSADRPAEDRS